MPTPSSETRSEKGNAPKPCASIRDAEASAAFSRSSFRMEDGLSTTSPAAIWSITPSGSWRILPPIGYPLSFPDRRVARRRFPPDGLPPAIRISAESRFRIARRNSSRRFPDPFSPMRARVMIFPSSTPGWSQGAPPKHLHPGGEPLGRHVPLLPPPHPLHEGEDLVGGAVLVELHLRMLVGHPDRPGRRLPHGRVRRPALPQAFSPELLPPLRHARQPFPVGEPDVNGLRVVGQVVGVDGGACKDRVFFAPRPAEHRLHPPGARKQ